MADSFDPYREALVMELDTVWPAGYQDLDPARRAQLEEQLHAKPSEAGKLEYLRTHTGFCRTIHVTAADLSRLGI